VTIKIKLKNMVTSTWP